MTTAQFRTALPFQKLPENCATQGNPFFSQFVMQHIAKFIAILLTFHSLTAKCETWIFHDTQLKRFQLLCFQIACSTRLCVAEPVWWPASTILVYFKKSVWKRFTIKDFVKIKLLHKKFPRKKCFFFQRNKFFFHKNCLLLKKNFN